MNKLSRPISPKTSTHSFTPTLFSKSSNTSPKVRFCGKVLAICNGSSGGRVCPLVEGLELKFETRKICEVGLSSHHLLVLVLVLALVLVLVLVLVLLHLLLGEMGGKWVKRSEKWGGVELRIERKV
ncbi:hypothetical protein TorRG33x02_189290 [Trema orientale]|uniref:Transmembrane protein n=1 Tax=Trema orientale TaxID=63057 RepID=A0A2P5EI91_TREOI|nr:hypothetical protein TorRG33x02_189290 [Trema orientale]